ncbi:hypothetical protein ABKN59_001622 [Abortiporus biennis]
MPPDEISATFNAPTTLLLESHSTHWDLPSRLTFLNRPDRSPIRRRIVLRDHKGLARILRGHTTIWNCR